MPFTQHEAVLAYILRDIGCRGMRNANFTETVDFMPWSQAVMCQRYYTLPCTGTKVTEAKVLTLVIRFYLHCLPIPVPVDFNKTFWCSCFKRKISLVRPYLSTTR